MFPLVPSYVLHTIALSFVPGLDSDDEAQECDLLAGEILEDYFWGVSRRTYSLGDKTGSLYAHTHTDKLYFMSQQHTHVPM
jgi:hypothetical protein